MTKPLIAVPLQVENPDTSLYSIKKRYLASLKQAGCAVVVLPPSLTEDEAAVVLDRVDGLLLPGGGDVDPARYGAVVASPHCSPTPERDRLEAALIRQAAERDMPLLGICRGMQIMNVALGGTLTQDVSPAGARVAHWQPEPYNAPSHPVRIDGESPLAAYLGLTGECTAIPVNSMHHQGVRDLAPALRPCAWADDGLVEAALWPEKRFFIAVQWHPEFLADDEPSLNLFRCFAEAARAFAAGRA